MPTMKPMNGSVTHPLSAHALEVLRRLAVADIPRQEINPGVVNRLFRENLVELVMLPSPYKTVRGDVRHLRITEAGRATVSASATR